MTKLESSTHVTPSYNRPKPPYFRRNGLTRQNNLSINKQSTNSVRFPEHTHCGDDASLSLKKSPWSDKRLRERISQEDLHDTIVSSNTFQDVARSADADYLMIEATAEREGRSSTDSKAKENSSVYLRPTIHSTDESIFRSSIDCPTKILDCEPPLNHHPEIHNTLTLTPSFLNNDAHGIRTAPSMSCRMTTRPHSFSTINERSIGNSDYDRSTLKSIYTSPQDGCQYFSALKIPIPSYRLGSPRFSAKGSAFMKQNLSRRHSEDSLRPYTSAISQSSIYETRNYESECIHRHPTFTPRSFDALTIKPLCDHPSIVRYSISGKISAATPPRLVAEITSPDLLDYDLLSDFFLTFRSFLDTADLMHILIARLEWSFLRLDSLGTVVSVRTFVAIRHWILNYFVDDFLNNWDLRRIFCDLLNSLFSQTNKNSLQFKVPLKILGELKKCWTRVCALYWNYLGDIDDQNNPDTIGPQGRADSNGINYSTNSHEESCYPEDLRRNNFTEKRNFLYPKLTSKRRKILTDAIGPELIGSVPRSTEQIFSGNPLSSQKLEKEVTCSPINCHKNINSESLPVKSVVEKRSATGKLSSKFDKKNRQSYHSDSESDINCYIAHRFTQKETDRNTKSPNTFPLGGSLGRNKFLKPRRHRIDVTSQLPPSKISNVQNESSYPLGNQHNASARLEPGIKRIISGVRRAFNTTTDQIVSSLNTQKCFPTASTQHAREEPIQQIYTSNKTPPSRLHTSISRAHNRIDLLSLKVARELEDLGSGITNKSNHKPLSDTYFRQINNQISEVSISPNNLDTLGQFSSDSFNQKSIDQVPSSRKSVFSNNSNTSRSFILSDFSYCPFVETFAKAYMRPSDSPTPPFTPKEKFIDVVAGPNATSMMLELREKTPSSGEAPSLVIDSYSSVEDEKSPTYCSAELSGIDHSGRGISLDMERSNQLQDSCLDSLTKWSSDQSHGAATLSEADAVIEEYSSDVASMPLRLRPLRRRPGGNLRSANNLEDNRPYYLCRPTSTTSRETESARDSGIEQSGIDNPRRNFEVSFKHSGAPCGSQQDLQSFFEKEVQLLAQLPDNNDDDGTAEAALLKLEGRFEKINNDSAASVKSWNTMQNEDRLSIFDICTLSSTIKEKDELNHHKNIFNEIPSCFAYSSKAYQPRGNEKVDPRNSCCRQSQRISVVSSNTTISNPSSMKAFNKCRSSNRNTVDTFLILESDGENEDTPKTMYEDMSNENCAQNLSTSRITSNFLPIQTNNFTDIILNPSTQYSFPVTTALRTSEPSSKMINIKRNSNSPRSEIDLQHRNSETVSLILQNKKMREYRGASLSMNPLRLHQISQGSLKTNSSHLAFILAFDSDILAQQFTLIEKDAVTEIDWRNILEMQWKDASLDIRSWVDYVRSQNPAHGLQAFMTRFNLMIKWVISECVLTQDISERVSCLMRFIQIADMCRKYRNFATMTQITIALASEQITCLSKTWVHVPAAEIQIFQGLRTLLFQSKTYQNLRAEMENSDSTYGCIPFIQIYTHDLLENFERSDEIIFSPSEPLINFDKCRKNAVIIKTLLRLLEASQNYQFSLIEEVFERCYWISALSEEQILAHLRLIRD